MQKAFNFMLGSLGGLFFLGMFVPRCGSRSAVIATLLSFAVGLVLAYWQQLCKPLVGFDVSPYWVIPCSTATSVVSGALLSAIEPQTGPALIPTWHRVVAEQPEVQAAEAP
jgi:Na+/proline symporter